MCITKSFTNFDTNYYEAAVHSIDAVEARLSRCVHSKKNSVVLFDKRLLTLLARMLVLPLYCRKLLIRSTSPVLNANSGSSSLPLMYVAFSTAHAISFMSCVIVDD